MITPEQIEAKRLELVAFCSSTEAREALSIIASAISGFSTSERLLALSIASAALALQTKEGKATREVLEAFVELQGETMRLAFFAHKKANKERSVH